ncbi:hypothetical protein HDU76_008208, partial [Blyttiomyces sp. JEL0837]
MNSTITSSSTSTTSPTSCWDHLPNEIKEAILDKCDPLTQLLNCRLSKDEISKHAHQIPTSPQLDFTGDLTILPASLPKEPYAGVGAFFGLVTRPIKDITIMSMCENLESMLLHIPLQQYWTDEAAFIEVKKLNKIK